MTPQAKPLGSATIRLCPQCNTMKIFTRDVCRRCEVGTQKESWSKEVHDILVYDGYTPSFNSEAEIDAYYEFLKRANLKIVQLISQALLSDRARLVRELDKEVARIRSLPVSNQVQGESTMAVTMYRTGVLRAISIIKESRLHE